jgi:hypothetical protein
MNFSAHNFDDFYTTSVPNRTGSPERNLILAILERAILDYTGNDEVQAKDAEMWLFEADLESDPEEFSFRWVCGELDLDVKDISEKIRNMPRRGNSRVPPWYQVSPLNGQRGKSSCSN